MAKGIKTGGRIAGVPNKTTALVKEALHEAFIDLGGVPALMRWGKRNRGEFYKLWARLIPTEVRLADSDGNVLVNERLTDGRKRLQLVAGTPYKST